MYKGLFLLVKSWNLLEKNTCFGQTLQLFSITVDEDRKFYIIASRQSFDGPFKAKGRSFNANKH
jgi:hypothetical protein